MKTATLIISFFICFGFNITNAQNQKPIVKDSLSVSQNVSFGQQVEFGDYVVKFDKLLTDSRCPKNVMCVRAGEAEVLVAIYKNGTFIKNQKISIDASGFVLESSNLAFNSNDFKIYGFGLTPYPTNSDDINKSDYVLELVFQPKVK